MNRRKRVRIGDLLKENGLISEEQLTIALAEQKRSGARLGHTLVELGYLSEDQMLEALSGHLKIPLIDLRHFHYKPEVVRLIPETYARRLRAIPLDESPLGLLVGMADPTDIFAFDELAKILKRSIRQAVVRESDLLNTIDQVHRRTSEIANLAEELGEEMSHGDTLAELLPDTGNEDAPVVRLLRSLLEDAVQVGASDIHIEPDESVLRIRQRIDGVLHEQVMKEKRIADALVLRLKLISGLDISVKRLPQDGRFNTSIRGKNIDIRVSTMPLQYGESVVLRLLDQSNGILRLEQIGLPAPLLENFRKIIHRPHGMVLVTGPTGSGKTTTLYSALKELNRAENKVITVEDPVEYRLPRVNQVQIHSRIGLSFAQVMRAALRQDPDVIMVGEMRDQETAEIGMRAAMTGHLVLSTLHTNDAVSTALRLLDMGAAGYVVASALQAVLAQRLVRRVCDSCSEPDPLTPQQRSWLKAMIGSRAEGQTFKHGRGCPRCNNTGYRGRIGIFELLQIDSALADALRVNDSAAFAAAARRQPGFQPLHLCALDYALDGVTTMEEVLRVSNQVEDRTVAEPVAAPEAAAPVVGSYA